MKKIINMSLMMALITVFTLSFTACSNDDDMQPAPTVALNEANIEGDILCVQADVVAKGRTATILLTVKGKDGTLKVTHPVTDNKYIGVLNIDGFHVHIDIAGKNIEEGDLLQMTVTDAEGQTVTVQKDITAGDDDDDED